MAKLIINFPYLSVEEAKKIARAIRDDPSYGFDCLVER